ncbi:hypothetical protein HYT57_03690 [Candidatus Woesearchaeota archaeon]|nr:hypothetical protein [Candidatus Woesearchaeota archaeon]
MKISKRLLIWVAAFGLGYLAASTDSDTVQERSRRNIEESQFGRLFRQVYQSPIAKIYGNGAKTADYRDTLNADEGLIYIIEARARDTSPVGSRNIGDKISGTVTTIGNSPEVKFTTKTTPLEQTVTPGFFGSLNLSSELFIGEGSQADIERFYRLLEKSLKKYN